MTPTNHSFSPSHHTSTQSPGMGVLSIVHAVVLGAVVVLVVVVVVGVVVAGVVV